MQFTNFKEEKNPPNRPDRLRIQKQGIHVYVNVKKFTDADTKQVVFYIPSLSISGYGETEEKAKEMAQFSLNDFLSYLSQLTPKKRDEELRMLGWKHHKLKNKEFSKAFVDSEGELQGFNAEDGKVEHVMLETA